MNYSIKVNKLEKENWSTKAFVSVVFEESFKVTDITIRETKNGEVFVAMPGYKTSKKDEQGNPIYKNYFYPTTAEFRKELYDNIIKAYESNAKEVNVTSGKDKVSVSVAMYPCNFNEKIESIGKIYIDKCFVIDGVRVIESEKGSFVAMPTKTTEGKEGKTEYSEVCYPVTKEFREQLYGEIIKKSNEVKEQKKEIGGFGPIRDFGEEKLPFR
ncbi:septation protein SpoVG family protein [uncultured Eubacterium sp.]|uniref:septation protein SpoVG family protein n=1 Tax=uncultured Eubacterium sp. TaxID=165185 RepID=UPI002603BCAC|nr:septation protein SpoVG family protein [uncultured Eubacterium sp.]